MPPFTYAGRTIADGCIKVRAYLAAVDAPRTTKVPRPPSPTSDRSTTSGSSTTISASKSPPRGSEEGLDEFGLWHSSDRHRAECGGAARVWMPVPAKCLKH